MSVTYNVYLASPRGFCAGVERAIDTVNLCLEKYGPPVFVLHEIVHNKHVIEELRKNGAVFVEHLVEVPEGEVCIFSAHGVSVAVEEYAKELGLQTVDATCPLVTSVHRMVERYHEQGHVVFIIGHHNHPEVEGTAGRVGDRVKVIATVDEAQTVQVEDYDRVAYVTQTTLAKADIAPILSALKKRFKKLKGPTSNICFATQNRQDAVKILAEKSDIVFVVGSKNSSNSNRLKEVARKCGVVAYLIDDHNDIDKQWLVGINSIGITAGASAPERLVGGVVDWLRKFGEVDLIDIDGPEENIHFRASELSQTDSNQ